VFLLPLIVFYEVAAGGRRHRVLAFDFLRKFFDLFGPAGLWVPGVAVVVILLATHLASGERWQVHWRRVGLMYVEAALLAVPLLALNWAIPLGSAGPAAGQGPSWAKVVDQAAMGIGAGVYEELVFRLVLISLVMMMGADLFGFPREKVAVVAVALSATLFAAHHHVPIGAEPFNAVRFTFRAVAGVYLAMIFWFRGYGPAAGCHAAYNVALTLNDVQIV